MCSQENIEEPTLCVLQSPDVATELVDRLNVLVFLDRVVDNSASCLEVCHSVLEEHRTDGDACVHVVPRKVEAADGTSIDAPSLLLEGADELDGLDLGRARYRPCWKDTPERVESIPR
jgi:hypothetical protein